MTQSMTETLIHERHSTARFGRAADRVFHIVTLGFAVLVLVLLTGIIVSLAIGSWPALKAMGFGFFTSVEWNPVTDRYGAVGPIYGTVVTSIIALVLAVPVSFGIALFLTELSPSWLRRPIGIAIELLAAIPSIIYGMWGLFVFAPFYADNIQPFLGDTLGQVPLLGALFEGPPLGIGTSAAGIILAIMIVPFIASVMRDVFETVPPVLKESAYGLGATTWEVASRIVLPYTRTSVIGGIMLGLGRALGETMAVTFVIGNGRGINLSLFYPATTISSAIANEFAEATSAVHASALMASGLALFVITFVVLALARLMLARLARKAGA